MTIRWSPESRDDVDRLADFVAPYDPDRAGEIEQELEQAPKKLRQFPRRGSRLTEFDPREVREYHVYKYLLRYELAGSDIVVLRFSTRGRTGSEALLPCGPRGSRGRGADV